MTQRELAHQTRPAKQAATTAAGLSKAVPIEMVKRMPEMLARPTSILWDKEGKSLLYVFNVSGDPRKGKFVVEVNYAFQYRPGGTGNNTRRIINNVVSAGMVAGSNLEDASKYYRIRPKAK